jgi:hypothetical protein
MISFMSAMTREKNRIKDKTMLGMFAGITRRETAVSFITIIAITSDDACFLSFSLQVDVL